ncbi:MAG: peptidoglycan-associated lipoprotein Pal [Nitrospinae bacterium]|nr:peptidoglycan-associated lipoprotein Pal [Nitrospinota bacterium]
MLLSGRIQSFQSFLMGVMLVFAVGCVKQTVETEELPPPKPLAPMVRKKPAPKPVMKKEMDVTEAERRRKRAAFKRSLAKFENDLVYFDFDKSEIRPDMRAILDTKARFLQEYPSLRVQIEGHCDERGTVEYNIALGHRRSQSSKDYLASLGVKASRVDTVSYGEERPADSRSNEAGWAKNRRAKFNIIGGIPAEMN